MGQFFSRKKGQTGGVGSEGGLSKGHNFSGFFSDPFPKLVVVNSPMNVSSILRGEERIDRFNEQ